jgi:integrase
MADSDRFSAANLAPEDVRESLGRTRSRAGVDDVRLHDLRHSYASVGATGGLSLLFVGKLLGHKRAAHLAEDPVRQAGEQISEAIASAMSEKRDKGSSGSC